MINRRPILDINSIHDKSKIFIATLVKYKQPDPISYNRTILILINNRTIVVTCDNSIMTYLMY